MGDRLPRSAVFALLLRSVLAALLLGAGGGGPRGEPLLERLEIVGTSAVERGEIEQYLLTERPRRWRPWRRVQLDEPTLDADMERIRALYRRRGYFEAQARYELEWNEERTRARARISIEEGPAVHIRAWNVDLSALPGDADAWEARLRPGLPQPGRVFDVDVYEATKEGVTRRLAESGHPLARVAGGAEVDLATHAARVDWRIDPGPAVRFGEVRVSGLHRVDDAVVRRELQIPVGDSYSPLPLERSQRALFDLGLFRSVILHPAPEEAEASPEDPQLQVWPIEVEVDERPPRSLSVGFGFGTDEGLRGRIAWQHRNFLGGARQVELALRASSRLKRIESIVRQRHVLAPRVELAARAAYERESVPSFDAERVRTDVSLARPLGRIWTGRIGYELAWNDVSEISEAAGEELDDPEGSFVLSSVALSLTREDVDEVLDPSRGSTLVTQVDVASSLLGSSFSFSRMGFEGRRYHPLGRATLACRLRVATIVPFAGTTKDEVPISERLFSGGGDSVRGFELGHLGPRDASGEPVGGTSLAEASVELRHPLRGKLGGVLFLDAGQVSLDPFSWRLDEVSYAVGTGLRYRTPIGPLRLDVGHVLNPDDRREIDRLRLHLSIGHAF